MPRNHFSIPPLHEAFDGLVQKPLQKPAYSLTLSLSCSALVFGCAVYSEIRQRRVQQRIDAQLQILHARQALIGILNQRLTDAESKLHRTDTELNQLLQRMEALREFQRRSFATLEQTLRASRLYPEVGAQLLLLAGDDEMNLTDLRNEMYHLAAQLHDGPDAEHADKVREFADALLPPAPEPEPTPAEPTPAYDVNSAFPNAVDDNAQQPSLQELATAVESLNRLLARVLANQQAASSASAPIPFDPHGAVVPPSTFDVKPPESTPAPPATPAPRQYPNAS